MTPRYHRPAVTVSPPPSPTTGTWPASAEAQPATKPRAGRTALASVGVVVWVLVIGSLADFGTTEARTAFALGIAAVAGPFVVADRLLR